MLFESVIQGDSIVISLALKDKSTLLPINLTGATARTALVDAAGVQKHISILNIISDATLGKIYHVIPKTVTANIADRTKLYGDVEITYSDGVVKTYAQTTYTVVKGYTNG